MIQASINFDLCELDEGESAINYLELKKIISIFRK